ncbi:MULTISPECIES: helix-turn-helix domain-containing protein [Empedobacter]|uniref:helix-turn-helix domain-containing protein n=1 Tax=Empedobacter TaxID=59734 RepID=UPI00257616C1|nr:MULTISPECIES: helix-turn-helix domain-containing protein [Empedobacter]MDM1042746.1 helix-turn-helix domain-containing protein [Empedobacter brevis]MDM1136676.1 helix-turn-helix domain-containing protein [Empedobacter sp. R750]
MENNQPDYKAIYADILEQKFPEKKKEHLPLLQKEALSAMDIIELNFIIFGTAKKNEQNNSHRFYGKSDILQILDYQKKHKLNNSQLADHFKLSRNIVAKWRKMFLQ